MINMEPARRAAQRLYDEMLFLDRESIEDIPHPVTAARQYLEHELGRPATTREVYGVMVLAEYRVIQERRRATL